MPGRSTLDRPPRVTWSGNSVAAGTGPVTFTGINVCPGLAVTLAVDATPAGPQVHRIEVVAEDGDAITGARLATVPLRVLAQAVVAQRRGLAQADGRISWAEFDRLLSGGGGPMRRPRGGSPEFDREVLVVFDEGQALGVGGVEAVSRTWDVHYNTAARWLRDARDRKGAPDERS